MQLYYALKTIMHGPTTYQRGEPVDFAELTERQRALQVKFKKARAATLSDVEKWKADGSLPVAGAPKSKPTVDKIDDALDLATQSIVERGSDAELTAQGKPTMDALRAELTILGVGNADSLTSEQRDAAFARVTGAN